MEQPGSLSLSRKCSRTFSFDDQRGVLPQRPARLPPKSTPPSHRRTSSTVSRHELHRDSRATLRGPESISQLLVPSILPLRPRSAPPTPLHSPLPGSPTILAPLLSNTTFGPPTLPLSDRSTGESTIRISRLQRKASARLRETFAGSVGGRETEQKAPSMPGKNESESSSPERDLAIEAANSTSSTARSSKTRPALASIDFAPTLHPSLAPLDPVTPYFSTPDDSSRFYLAEASKSSQSGKVNRLRKGSKAVASELGEKESAQGFVARFLRLKRSTPSLSWRGEHRSTLPPSLPLLPTPSKHLNSPPFAQNHSVPLDTANSSTAEAMAREVSVALLSLGSRDRTYSLRNLSSNESLPLGSSSRPSPSCPSRLRNPSLASSSSRRTSEDRSSHGGHALASPTPSTASSTFGGPIASFDELKRSLPASRASSSSTSLPKIHRPSPQYPTPLSPPPRRATRSGSRPPPPPLIVAIPPSRPATTGARSSPASPTSRTAVSVKSTLLDGYASRTAPDAALRTTNISPGVSAVFGAAPRASHPALPPPSSPTPSSCSSSTSSSSNSSC